jgi:hypothetical protein
MIVQILFHLIHFKFEVRFDRLSLFRISTHLSGDFIPLPKPSVFEAVLVPLQIRPQLSVVL